MDTPDSLSLGKYVDSLIHTFLERNNLEYDESKYKFNLIWKPDINEHEAEITEWKYDIPKPNWEDVYKMKNCDLHQKNVQQHIQFDQVTDDNKNDLLTNFYLLFNRGIQEYLTQHDMDNFKKYEFYVNNNLQPIITKWGYENLNKPFNLSFEEEVKQLNEKIHNLELKINNLENLYNTLYEEINIKFQNQQLEICNQKESNEKQKIIKLSRFSKNESSTKPQSLKSQTNK